MKTAASPTQSWQTGHGPATLKHISNTNVRNRLARHCKPDCNSELRLISPNRSEAICHFRIQVKRAIFFYLKCQTFERSAAQPSKNKTWEFYGVSLCEGTAMVWQAAEPACQSNCLQCCRLSWRLRNSFSSFTQRISTLCVCMAHSPITSNQMAVRNPKHGLKSCV